MVRASPNNSYRNPTTVAGTGDVGFGANMLNYPYGIFVTTEFGLYVADTKNNRIQYVQSGGKNAVTVTDTRSPKTITLDQPTGVVLDGDGCLFIVDSNNNRVVRSGPHGFRCVVGCSGSGGSRLDQLSRPQSLSFDSDGNMFVADHENNRIQKFLLSKHSCSKWKKRTRLQFSPPYIK